MADPLGVALVGCGTVGSGVARLLLEQPDRLAARAGRPIVLRRVVVRDPDRPRAVALPRELLTTDLDRALNDPAVHVVVELVGGVDWARQAVLRALAAGKDVVTANKALLATLAANQIISLQGILNGTCNYILTQMTEQGQTYEQALAEAQRLGYAEADPTLDVDGTDSAHKLAILAQIAFGMAAPLNAIERRSSTGETCRAIWSS